MIKLESVHIEEVRGIRKLDVDFRKTTRRGFLSIGAAGPFLRAAERVFGKTRREPSLRESVPRQALTLDMGVERPEPPNNVPYPPLIDQGNLDGTTGGMGGISWRSRHTLKAHPFISNPTDRVLPESAIVIREKDMRAVWTSPVAGYPSHSVKSQLLSSWDWVRGLLWEKTAKLKAFHPYTQYEYPAAPGMATGVTIRQYSPLVPGDTKASSLPVEINEIQLENTSSEEREVCVLMPTANIVGWNTKSVYPFEEMIPTGDHQAYQESAQGPYKGIVMGLAPGQKAADDRLAGQMAIFVEQQAGMRIERTVFAAEDGADVWGSFSRTGRVQDLRRTTPVGNEQAAAVVVRMTLKAYERCTIHASLAYDFPNDVRNEKHFYRFYTNQVGTEGTHAKELAVLALKNRAAWTKAIQLWQDKVLSVPGIPDYVKTTALNELYFLFAGGTMFTKDGHIYFIEGLDARVLNTLDVWFYTPMLARFFPDLEQDILLGFAEQVPKANHRRVGFMNPFIAVDAQGHDLTASEYGGDPIKNRQRLATPDRPFDADGPDKGYEKVANAPEGYRDGSVLGPISEKVDSPTAQRVNRYWQNGNVWKDLSPKFVLQVWRAYQMNPVKRKDFLEKAWVAVVDILVHQEEFDADGDGLPDHQGFPDWTYDDWSVKGPTTYTAILTMESLAAAMAIAHELGLDDDPNVRHYRKWLERGKKSIQDKLWNKELGFFNIAEGNDDIMAAALLGILYAKQFSLEQFGGPVVSDEQVRSHLRAVYEKNFMKFAGGQRGVVSGIKADGTLTKGDQSVEVWIGAQRMIAALMIKMGMETEGYQILKVDYDNLLKDGRFLDRTPEAITADGKFRFSTYMRGGAIWWVYEVISPSCVAHL